MNIQLTPDSIVEGYEPGMSEKDPVTLVKGTRRIQVCWGSVIAHTHGEVLERVGSASAEKVGPKGYIHGWIFVGPQAIGGRVFNSEHGHGRVASHGDSHVDVHFDNGHKESYRARFNPDKKPRLYGPAKSDAEMRAKPDVPPMTEMKHPKLAHNLTLSHTGFAINPEGRTVGEVESYGPLDNRTYSYHHALTGFRLSGFGAKEDALQALADHDTKYFDDQFAKQEAKRLQRAKLEEEAQYAREVEDKHIFAPRRAAAAKLSPVAYGKAGAKASRIEARRRRIVDLHGTNLRIHDDVDDPKIKKHLKEFFSIPESHHEVIAKRNYKIDIGRGTVADYHPELADIQPGGYSKGKTWKDSSGAHDSGGTDRQPWLVFGNTVGHGSHAVVVHEMGHAMDYSLNPYNLTMTYPISGNEGIEPWGVGFQSYFRGLNEYDADSEIRARDARDKRTRAWMDARPAGMSVEDYNNGPGGNDFPQFTDREYQPVRLLPYYRDTEHGGHGSGAREMFAEAYSAYVTSPKAKRAEAISRTLHGGVFDGDDHVGAILVDYFDDMTTWLEANK